MGFLTCNPRPLATEAEKDHECNSGRMQLSIPKGNLGVPYTPIPAQKTGNIFTQGSCTFLTEEEQGAVNGTGVEHATMLQAFPC